MSGEPQQLHRIEQLNSDAILAARRGDDARAEALWSEALALDDAQIRIRGNLARLLFKAGRDAAVIDLLEGLPSAVCSPALLMLLGQSALRLRRYATAHTALVAASQLVPGDPSVLLALSQAAVGSGLLDQAVSLLQGLHQRFPDAPEPLLNLAVAMGESGRLEEAAGLHATLLERYGDQEPVRLNATRFFLQLGDLDQAEASFQPLCDRVARSLPLALLNAELALARGDQAASQDALAAARALDPRNLDVALPLFYSLLEQGDHGSATSLIADLQPLQLPEQPSTRLFAAIADLPTDAQRTLGLSMSFAPRDLVLTHELLDPADALLQHCLTALGSEQTLLFERPGKPTRGGSQSHEVLDRSDGPWPQLQRCLRGAVSRYLDDRAGDNEWLKAFGLQERAPESLRLSGWGVVLQSGGRQLRHTHPEAVLSGVLYLALPPLNTAADPPEGALWFSPSACRAGSEPGLCVQPAVGLLALFPSFLPHETIPYQGEGQRVCLAFNVS